MPLVATRSGASAFGLGWSAAAAGGVGAMTAIASSTLGSTATTVTFSSIPSTYDDLYLVMNIRGGGSGSQPRLRLNGSTSSSLYSHTVLYGDGPSAASYLYPTGTASYFEMVPGSVTNTANFTMSIACHILNYKNTSYKKTVLARGANDKNGSGEASLAAGLFHSTSAVSQLDIVSSTSLGFNIGSVFALYGITKAS